MILLFDMNNALHKSFFMYKKIYSHDDSQINERLFFNKFMVDFGSTIRKFSNVEKVVCCYDHQNNFRKDLSTEYKANRSKKPFEFYNVLNYSKDFLSSEGFIVTCIENIEADDCIALWCENEKTLDKTKCIVSADEDVRQLISKKVFVYNNNSSYERAFCLDDNFETYEKICRYNLKLKSDSNVEFVNPDHVIFNKMILGCESDQVKKLIKGRVGEKTLEKKVFLYFDFDRNFSNKYLLRVCEKINSSFKDENISILEIEENIRLVCLSSKFIPNDSLLRFKDHAKLSSFSYSGNYLFV